ncbi:MAG TPA: cache domain-containing protein [Pseudolabrys sp.]
MTGISIVGNLLGRFSRPSMFLVCAGFSAFVLGLCMLAGEEFKERAEQDLYRDTGNIAQMLMGSFEEASANLDAVLGQVSDQLRGVDIAATNETTLRQLLTRYALRETVIGPAIIDRNGTLIASARVDPVPKISLKDRSIFRIHAENPGETGVYISVPTQGDLTNEWSIQFSRTLRDANGIFNGVVVASYRLSHFNDVYEKLKLSDQGIASLTGNDGVVRIRSLSGTIGYGAAIPKMARVYERVLAGEKRGTFFGISSADSITRFGTFVASETTPFYVVVAYENEYLRNQYLGIYWILALCWFVLTAAMIASVFVIQRLENASQLTRLEVVKSAMEERQKISADMHDSIGASLSTLLAHFSSETMNLADIKRRIGEILMELRLLVDSAEPVGGDLNLILGNVRHRMASAIELAGIEFRWRVQELPTVTALSSRDALSMKLILMEALSNVLHHSDARSVTLSAIYDEAASAIIITVADDGRGFDVNAKAGRGISNMNMRTRKLSTGGALAVEANPGKGTTVRIELRVPPANRTGATLPDRAA